MKGVQSVTLFVEKECKQSKCETFKQTTTQKAQKSMRNSIPAFNGRLILSETNFHAVLCEKRVKFGGTFFFNFSYDG